MNQTKQRKSSRGLKLSQIILIIIFIPVTLILIVSIIIGYTMEKNELVTTISELNYTDANEKSKAIESLFYSMEDSLEEVATRLTVIPMTDEGTEPYVHTLLHLNNFFDYAYVVNAEGVIVQVSPKHQVLAKGNQVTSKAALEALKLKKPLISEPYLCSMKKHTIVMSHPIYSETGTYLGFIAGALDLQGINAFHDILKTDVSALTRSYSYVVDKKKRVLYHPDASRFLDFENNNRVVDQVIAGQDGASAVTNSRGQDYIAGYAYIENLEWGIVTQTPQSYINERAGQLTKQLLYVTLPCFIVLFVLSIWIASRLTLPIKQMMTFMVNYLSKNGKAKDLTHIRSRWNYETNELKELLSTMVKDVEEETSKLYMEAITDPLTGLLNRRDLDLSQTIHGPYGVVLIDIDHFKQINDTYGHLKGDEVIVTLAQLLQRVQRENDIFCRYGGEEFLLLLPATNEHETYRLAEGIRHVMETCTPLSFDHNVTVSAGICTIPNGTMPLEQMVEAADQALYDAKNGGRNRVVIHRQLQ